MIRLIHIWPVDCFQSSLLALWLTGVSPFQKSAFVIPCCIVNNNYMDSPHFFVIFGLDLWFKTIRYGSGLIGPWCPPLIIFKNNPSYMLPDHIWKVYSSKHGPTAYLTLESSFRLWMVQTITDPGLYTSQGQSIQKPFLPPLPITPLAMIETLVKIQFPGV